MSRRQTLGVLSPSQLNVRALNGQSSGPTRVTGAAGKEALVGVGGQPGTGNGAAGAGAGPQRSRKSMAPTADKSMLPPSAASAAGLHGGHNGNILGSSIDPRRSSAFGAKASGPKEDPRRLGDKQFRDSCMHTIITYLSRHSYPASISTKVLSSPTGKDFREIVQFLMQQFDPNMRGPITKVEEDVPLFFKRIHYPFPISKTALCAVGSAQSWPALLAALTWLVELLNYNERVESSQQQEQQQGVSGGPGVLEDTESHTKRQFFEYICRSYGYWLTGNDTLEAAVDADVKAGVTEQLRRLRERLAAVNEANRSVVSEVARLQSEPSPLVVAQQRRAERALDTQKFEQLIENLQGMKDTLKRKIHERQADINSKQEALAAAERDNAALRARIAAQPVNKADMARMVMERTKQKEVLEAVSSQAEELEAKVHQQEVQFVSALKQAEGAVGRYNQLVHRLQLLPASGKRAAGTNYELRLNRDASTPHEFASVDLKGVVKPGLERLCEAYRTKAAQLGRDLLAKREEAASKQEQLTERTEENAAIEAQIERLEGQLRALRDAQEERVRIEAARAGRVREEVDGLRSTATHLCAATAERKQAVRAQYEALQRTCEEEVKVLRANLEKALQAMISHRMHVQEVLGAAAHGVRGIEDQLKQFSLPVPAQ